MTNRVLFTLGRPVLVLAALCVAATARAENAESDAHDAVVYQRYAKGEFKSPFAARFQLGFLEIRGSTFAQLTEPATEADVKARRAIFTFEGLGPRRVWKLPACPIYALWTTNHRPPVKTTGDPDYDNGAFVYQAEELSVGGKWKRYFGLVPKNGAAVVPAADVNLWLPESASGEEWTRYLGGIDWSHSRPYDATGDGKPLFQLEMGQAIAVRMKIRNRCGAPQPMPVDLYRRLADGRHSFRRGITVSLQCAPYDPRNPSPDYPTDEDYADVPRRYATHVPDVARADDRPLETGQIVEVFSGDLRELFDIRKPGYYKYTGGGGRYTAAFQLGKQPPKLTLAQLNAEIGMLGGRGVEERLRKAIEAGFETIPPDRPDAAPLPEDFPAFSRQGFEGGSLSGMESELVRLAVANGKLLDKLPQYSASSVRREFEKRMLEEKESPALRLLYVSVAAAAGSRKAAEVLLESMKSTEYDTVLNTHSAIRRVLRAAKDRGAEPPDWAVQLALAALADRRYVTGLEKSEWSPGTIFRVSYLADEFEDLALALDHLKR